MTFVMSQEIEGFVTPQQRHSFGRGEGRTAHNENAHFTQNLQ